MVPPSKYNSEAKERRHWAAFWQEVPPWAKTAIIALGAAAGSSYLSAGTGNTKQLEAEIRDLQLSKVKIETTLDGVKEQLDRIERKLDRGRLSSGKRVESEG